MQQKKILLFLIVILAGNVFAQKSKPFLYKATEASLSKRQTPTWYGNAKLGIFIHWGLYSVPAWAIPYGTPDTVTNWKAFYTNNPYAEWYLNSLRITGSPTQTYHTNKYGAGFDYYNFKDSLQQKTTNWNAGNWAAIIKSTGAKYVVITAKHHDGYLMYPSKVQHPFLQASQISSPKDFIGALAIAVRAKNIKMGIYYSGGLDWSFTTKPVTNLWPDLFEAMPPSKAYAKYADAQMHEIINRYQPDVLWNDVNYPKGENLLSVFAHLFNTNHNAVVNDRWNQYPTLYNFTTPEYAVPFSNGFKKWETCRGIGFSFGYNQTETDKQLLSSGALINLLVDIVSKNGNLLINIGPDAAGNIPANQLTRLKDLGNWMQVNSEGIYDTHPWKQTADTLRDSTAIRFTKKQYTLYVFFLQKPTTNSILLKDSSFNAVKSILWVDKKNVPLHFIKTAAGVEIILPKNINFTFARMIKINGVK
ncbi:MAG: alpha-L-fucosidase [Chitinophagaceae bacterium]